MNQLSIFLLKVARKAHHIKQHHGHAEDAAVTNPDDWATEAYCDLKNQEANDWILAYLDAHASQGVMMSKWGTIEFDQALNTFLRRSKVSARILADMVTERMEIPELKANEALYYNAGVFPMDAEVADRFGAKALGDCQHIDILGSYMRNEQYLAHYWSKAMKVNLDAFYAPWLFQNPWTGWLKDKRVVVVHPFAESIRRQYEENRTRLFENSNVLPEFKTLTCLKAVQSQAGETTGFSDWFEALRSMEHAIDQCDYDVAIIGCGAYGMSLAAHVKRQGKVALHLAGWTQMLFGVYGERWVSQQPKYGSVINQYWVRPEGDEVIRNAAKIEDGCYW